MVSKAHKDLAKRMNKLGIRALLNDKYFEILTLLFTEEEAEILSKTPIAPATAEKIAKRAGRPVEQVRAVLDNVVKKGLITGGDRDGVIKYMVLPFMPGLFEWYTVMGPDDEMKKRFAELYEVYHNADFARNFSKRPISIARVIPMNKSIPNTIGVLPSDSFRAAVDRHDFWAVADCACRKQNSLIGTACDKPMEVCMQFGNAARGSAGSGFSREVSREEIFDIIDMAEDAGLVHVTDNVEFPHVSCNCCGCCCDAIASINKHHTNPAFVNSRFMVQHNRELCKGCGKCTKACPVGTIHVYNKKLIFEPWRCIGCGACVNKCQQNALSLTLREDSQKIPQNYGQMIVNGLTELIGINRPVTQFAPRFIQKVGDWIQEGMNKKMEKKEQD